LEVIENTVYGFFSCSKSKGGQKQTDEKFILRLLLDDIGFIFLLILSAYYSRFAIYKILHAFFNITSQIDSLLIGLDIQKYLQKRTMLMFNKASALFFCLFVQ
jgi:hypothetical protein